MLLKDGWRLVISAIGNISTGFQKAKYDLSNGASVSAKTVIKLKKGIWV